MAFLGKIFNCNLWLETTDEDIIHFTDLFLKSVVYEDKNANQELREELKKFPNLS